MRHLFLMLLTVGVFLYPEADAQVRQFVTRSGANLIVDGKPFRCAGVNIYWLGLDENVGWIGYPTHFRVDDALATAKEMGATVVRAHTLGVSTGNPLSVEPSLNEFNDAAFAAIDYAIAKASKLGLRLVIPLTDNYAYYHGGRHNFTDWRGMPVSEFYTNSQVIADFEAYIDHLLEHRSSITGVALKDEPAILAWETGNEIRPPTAWTGKIAAYIKSVDRHHLVLDGHYGVDTAVLEMEDVDLVGAHFNGTAYPMTAAAVASQTALSAGRRPFFAGEFDWNNHHKTGDLNGFLAAIAANRNIAGATMWSLFSHRDDFGYVTHNDGFTLHYPGDTPEMSEKVMKLRRVFYAIQGLQEAPAGSVAQPEMTFADAARGIAWRGVAGAASYELERAMSPDSRWSPIIEATDNDTPVRDPQPVSNAWYRVRAKNTSGIAGPYSKPLRADGHE